MINWNPTDEELGINYGEGEGDEQVFSRAGWEVRHEQEGAFEGLSVRLRDGIYLISVWSFDGLIFQATTDSPAEMMRMVNDSQVFFQKEIEPTLVPVKGNWEAVYVDKNGSTHWTGQTRPILFWGMSGGEVVGYTTEDSVIHGCVDRRGFPLARQITRATDGVFTAGETEYRFGFYRNREQ